MMREEIALKESLLEKPRTAWLTSGQSKWLAVQLCLVGSYLLGVVLFDFDGVSILFNTLLGQKMLLAVFVMMGVGFGGQLLACVVLNQILPADNPSLTIGRNLLSWAMNGTLVVLYGLPLLMVFLVGPSALKIMDAMAMP